MLASCFHIPHFSRSFRFLSSASFPVPVTLLCAFPFPFLPVSPGLGFPVLSFPFGSLSFPVFTADLSSVSFGFRYLAFCQFPFVLPCFAPTAVPQVLLFWISPRRSVPSFPFLSSGSCLSISLLSLCSSFSHFLPVFASQLAIPVLLICFRFSGFPLLSSLVSRAFFPVPCFRLSVCFLSPHPVSLPQLLDRCLPFAFAFGTFRDLSGFFRPLVTASGYSALPFFSLLPDFPRLGSFGACFPLPFRLLPCDSSGFGTQLTAIPFSVFLFRLTVATQFPTFPFGLGRSP